MFPQLSTYFKLQNTWVLGKKNDCWGKNMKNEVGGKLLKRGGGIIIFK